MRIDRVVAIDIDGVPTVRCRAAEILSANTGYDVGGYHVTLVLVRDGVQHTIRIKCADRDEAVGVLVRVGDEMRGIL